MLRRDAGGTERAAKREKSAADATIALRRGAGSVRAAGWEQFSIDAGRALRGGVRIGRPAGREQFNMDAGRALRGCKWNRTSCREGAVCRGCYETVVQKCGGCTNCWMEAINHGCW